MPGIITVAILEPDLELRRCIRAWLESAGDIMIAGEAQDEEQAGQEIPRRRPQVLLADLDALSGPQAIADLMAQAPATRIIVLHSEPEQSRVLEALQQGAVGHLAKEGLRPAEVVEAVRTVAQGGAYLSPAVAGRMLDEIVFSLRGRSRKGTFSAE